MGAAGGKEGRGEGGEEHIYYLVVGLLRFAEFFYFIYFPSAIASFVYYSSKGCSFFRFLVWASTLCLACCVRHGASPLPPPKGFAFRL